MPRSSTRRPAEPVDAASLRQGLRYGAIASLVFAAFNLSSRWFLPAGADVELYDGFLAVNLPLLLVAGVLLYSASRVADPLAQAERRVIAGTVVAGGVLNVGTWLIGGPAAGLNLLLGIVLVAFVRLYMPRRHGRWTLGAVVVADVVLGGLRLAGAFGSTTVLPAPELSQGPLLLVLAIAWRQIVVCASYLSASYAADRFRTSEEALRTLNAELEQRVAEQVAALERAARLRRYLSPQIVEEVLGAAEDPVESRDRRPVTVMFADMRGFTGLVERLAPDVLADTLNLYFDEVAQVAFRHGGTIDKFIGDAVMVFFGAPRASGAEDQARRCVRMAVDVQSRVHELAHEFERLTGAPAEVRIGVASGVATVGGFGSSHRIDFTVVGAPVNRAARLEPLAPAGTVLIDEETRQLIGDAFPVERLADVQLKGFKHAQAVYRVSL